MTIPSPTAVSKSRPGDPDQTSKPKLIIIGGFLGAGKTTTLSVLGQHLQRQGKKVGLITNDQTNGLVDTQLLETGSAPVQEVAGSCFCCDFTGFMGAVDFLIARMGCDTVLAEPVGSCTDLSATLFQPIKSLYSETIDLAPLSVLVDPDKLLDVMKNGDVTGEGTDYIYRKQLEEADYIVINKTDLLDAPKQSHIEGLMHRSFEGYPICWISALHNSGLDHWSERLYNDHEAGKRLAEVDYDIYAAAEATTGWYNGSFTISASRGEWVDWEAFGTMLLELFQKVFEAEALTIDHLKVYLRDGPSHLVGNITSAEKSMGIRGNAFHSPSVRMVLNIRAETDHDHINEITEDILYTMAGQGLHFKPITVSHLAPGRPTPEYRFDKVVSL